MMNKVIYLLAWFVFGAGPAVAQQRQLIDRVNLDTKVDPGDDFYQYANGGWMAAQTIPPGEPGLAESRVLQLNNFRKVRQILENATIGELKGRMANLIGNFYASAMDTVRIDQLGLLPVKAELQAIRLARNSQQLLKEVAREHTVGVPMLFEFYTRQDQGNSRRMIACFEQGGLVFQDPSYYTGTEARFRTGYLQYVRSLLGISQAAAQKVWQLETQLAAASQSQEQQRDVSANYHKYAAAKLPGGFDWRELMVTLRLRTDSVMIFQPNFFKKLGQLQRAVPLAVWQDYVCFHLLDSRAAYLDKTIRAAAFDFHGRLLQGLTAGPERWEEVSGQIDDLLGDALGYCYIKTCFSPLAKLRMDSLCGNIRSSFADHVRHLDWMSPETKQKALQKLAAMRNKIGYPAHWDNYPELKLAPGAYAQNAIACLGYRYRKMLRELLLPPDPSRWGMTPPTVNAYYDFSKNEIVFPAGIEQFPFFDPEADDAFNYGGIGAVIGHELTHGFDDQGRKYDSRGNLHPWWMPADTIAFNRLTNEMIRIYSKCTILDSLHVNGRLTLGENIADFGGVALAWDAFTHTRQYGENKKIDGFTPAQRFFLSYAQSRRRIVRESYLREFIKTNDHAPSDLRVNIPLANFRPFYEAFGLKPGDKLFKPAEQRLQIW
ncbi:MAG TPA: M13 family metallopeptidase [Mucilaginibacter sp.]|jgi:putative endopeptidase|nr:M13 family metallopeptidase [Mucilaginibacter sp.]